MKYYFVYILTNKKHGTLYTGITSNLISRILQHKEGIYEGFSKKYDLSRLVYYEVFTDIHYAIAREKQLKRWRRDWKIKLIEKDNPEWDDLYPGL